MGPLWRGLGHRHWGSGWGYRHAGWRPTWGYGRWGYAGQRPGWGYGRWGYGGMALGGRQATHIVTASYRLCLSIGVRLLRLWEQK